MAFYRHGPPYRIHVYEIILFIFAQIEFFHIPQTSFHARGTIINLEFKKKMFENFFSYKFWIIGVLN